MTCTAYAGTTDQHSVEQTAGLPIVIERVRSGLQEAKKLAACSGKVVLVLGANPIDQRERGD